jgi:hypothetical protein
MTYDDRDALLPVEGSNYESWFEGIRVSAAIALSHMCKLNPQLFPVIFETIKPRVFCEILLEKNSGQYRVQ